MLTLTRKENSPITRKTESVGGDSVLRHMLIPMPNSTLQRRVAYAMPAELYVMIC
jgi:hypothetical protein